MLKSLLIKNFKSYKFAKIDLHPRVNVFFGESNDGKTNLLRAIKLLAQNRPSRVKYFSNFAGVRGVTKIRGTFEEDNDKPDTVVELKKEIRRDKTGKKKLVSQEYSVNPGNFTYSGFKTSVPDKVIDAVNLNDINFQSQLDSSFILTSSGGKIAKVINEITGLNNVSVWQSAIDSRIKESEKRIKELKTDQTTYNNRINQLSELPTLKSKIKEFLVLSVKCGDLEDDVYELGKTLSSLSSIERTLSELTPLVSTIKEKDAELYEMKIEEDSTTVTLLSEFIDIEDEIETEEKFHEKYVTKYRQLLRKLKACPLCGSTVKDVDKLLEVI